MAAARRRKAAARKRRVAKGGQIPLGVLKKRAARLNRLIRERESRSQGSLF